MSQTTYVAAPLLLLALPLSPPAGPSPQASPRVTATVSVTAVDLDVSVTKNGEPVPDLRAEDVVLKIDGKVVPLDYFSRVETGRPAGPAGRTARSGRGPAGAPSRTFLLLLDEDHLLPQDRPRAADAARTLVARLGASDALAVAALDRGTLRALAPVEADRLTTLAAVERFSGEKKSGLLTQQNLAIPLARNREAGAFRELERAVRAIGAVPGRKEMILVSRGLSRFDDLRLSRLVRPIVKEFDDLVQSANRSRVTVHTIAAAGLEAGHGGAPGACPPYG